MNLNTKEIQARYQGFLQTPILWKHTNVFGLKPFEITTESKKINLKIDEKLRLGKYIERFVSHQLKCNKAFAILAENIQIQQQKRTLGEIDCILLRDNKPIHLEIIYKFYVYDSSIGKTEIEHFIGPNKKDSLIEKLTKLKEKQLPLLYSKECKSYLKTINLDINNIEQQVYFKAQLFVPFNDKYQKLKTLNQNCIVGYYIHQQALQIFKNCKFYIPIKKDWLLKPHTNVSWLHYDAFFEICSSYMTRKYSPLVWAKSINGEINKLFIVWW